MSRNDKSLQAQHALVTGAEDPRPPSRPARSRRRSTTPPGLRPMRKKRCWNESPAAASACPSTSPRSPPGSPPTNPTTSMAPRCS